MATNDVFPKSKSKSKKPAAGKDQQTQQPEASNLTYGPLKVVYVDKTKRRVYVGVDPEKSTSRIEELQSEDAKQLAVWAAVESGLSNASILNQPSLAYFSTIENKPVSAALGDQQGVEMCLEVEVTAFGYDNGFVGDSADAFPS